MPLVAGVMIGVGVLSLIVSRYARAKLNRLHDALVGGHEQDPAAIRAAFGRYDKNGDGVMSPAELTLVASALGCQLTNDELVAVFGLLDRDLSGEISFEEFSQWWVGDTTVDYSMV